jgi:hypothetical protein
LFPALASISLLDICFNGSDEAWSFRDEDVQLSGSFRGEGARLSGSFRGEGARLFGDMPSSEVSNRTA